MAGALTGFDICRRLFLPADACVAHSDAPPCAKQDTLEALHRALDIHLYPALLNIVVSYCCFEVPFVRVMESSSSDSAVIRAGLKWLVDAVVRRTGAPRWWCSLM